MSRILQSDQIGQHADGSLGNKFDHELNFGYSAGHLAWLTDGYARAQNPFYTETFDSGGRATKLTFTATMGRTPNVTSTETARYDAHGIPTGFTITRTNGEHMEIKVERKTTDAGETVVSWSAPGARQTTEYTDLTFDKTGRIVRNVLSFNETQISDTSYKYNDHGDLESSVSHERGNHTTTMTIEYQYDDQGNWTRQTRTTDSDELGAKKKSVTALYTREITYMQKSPAAPQNVDGSALVGSYHAEQGDPTHDKFHSTTLMELKPDGDVTIVLSMPDITKPGQMLHNWSDGRWTFDGSAVHITLDMANGKPVGNDEQKTLTLSIKESNQRLTAAGGPDFQRDQR